MPQHEISNNVVCATSKGSDQPAHMRSLIRAFADRLNILCGNFEQKLPFLSINPHAYDNNTTCPVQGITSLIDHVISENLISLLHRNIQDIIFPSYQRVTNSIWFHMLAWKSVSPRLIWGSLPFCACHFADFATHGHIAFLYFSRKMGYSQSRTQLETKDWFLFSASVYTKYISGCVILAVLLGGRECSPSTCISRRHVCINNDNAEFWHSTDIATSIICKSHRCLDVCLFVICICCSVGICIC